MIVAGQRYDPLGEAVIACADFARTSFRLVRISLFDGIAFDRLSMDPLLFFRRRETCPRKDEGPPRPA